MGRIITKVKIDRKGYPEIHYVEHGKYGDPECKLVGVEKAPKLEEAMQKLLPALIDWNHLDRLSWMTDGSITQISIKHVEGQQGITLVGLGLFVDEAPYAVNATSPYLNPDKITTPQSLIVIDVCTEADSYLNGQPIQMNLVA